MDETNEQLQPWVRQSWVRGHFYRFFLGSMVIYLAGFAYLHLVLQEDMVMTTYMSEPSLMPGYVTEKFDRGGLANELAFNLKQAKSVAEKSSIICESLLQRAGLPCFSQNWTSNVAFHNSKGTNLYTVVRAKRSTGVEAMLFAVDFNQHPRSTAALIAFAQYAKDQIYWYRDIFIVFTDGGASGLDAFLQEYHLVRSSGIRGEPLQTTGGFFISGISCRDWGYDENERNVPYSVQLNHLNGQQANLDLINVMIKIGSRTLDKQPHIYAANISKFEIEAPWFIPYRAMWTQAFIPIEGLHSVMGKYRVEGATAIVPTQSGNDLTKYGKLVEGIARSLNVAHERLHQSYFMYVMLSSNHFISIAYFYPMVVIFVVPLLIFILYEYLHNMCITFQVPPTWCLFHFYGLSVWIVSYWYFANLGTPSTIIRDSAILLGLISMPTGILMRPQRDEIQPMRVYILTETALLAASLALTNFSQALAFSIIATPVVYAATLRIYETLTIKVVFLLRMLRVFFVLIAQPFVLLLVVSQYGTRYFGQTPYLAKIEFKDLPSTVSDLLRLQMLYGSNMLPLLTVLIMPIWNTALACAISPALSPDGAPMGEDEQDEDDQVNALFEAKLKGTGKIDEKEE